MAFIGYGCDLQFNAVTVGSVVEINGPTFKVKDVDTSNIQMSQPFRTFQAGLADGGDVTFTLIYAKANFNTLYNNLRTSGTWLIIFSDLVSTASQLSMSGFLSGLSGKFPLDDMIVFDCTVKVSGKPTFTQGT